MWLCLRRRGVSVYAVAAESGVVPARVDAATSAVRKADMNESGEPPLEVAAHYWKTRNR